LYMRYRRPRGVNDILPDEVEQWQRAETAFRRLCKRYRYREIRTPVFEQTGLFTRTVGEESDIVRKEMYTFEDKGGHSLTLRAEGTAPTVRAFIENNLQGQDRERLVKLYYIAPIFRYDRPQAGRYRQHHQAGVEAIGSSNPAVDAEVIDLALAFYQAMGLEGVQLRLNSVGCPKCTPAYVETLKAALGAHVEELCPDCQRRYERNPLRILDCKQPACRRITEQVPKLLDMLCDECREHFEGLVAALDLLGIEYVLDPQIVRGLDYYTKTAFEFVCKGLGAQDSIGGGGRYDGLVEQCGGEPTPGVGFGIGLERVLLARKALGLEEGEPAREGVLVAALNDEAWAEAIKLTSELRDAGIIADLDYRRRSLRSQLRFANSEGFAATVILGEDELAKGVVVVRNMQTGEQQQVARTDAVEYLRNF